MLLLLLFSIAAASPEGDEYYGVSVGGMEQLTAGTRAEVFVADGATLVFKNLLHQPAKRGCIAVQLGPAKESDIGRKVGDGVLLPYAVPNFQWEEIRRVVKRHRARRQVVDNFMARWPKNNAELSAHQDQDTSKTNKHARPLETVEEYSVEYEDDSREENPRETTTPPLLLLHTLKNKQTKKPSNKGKVAKVAATAQARASNVQVRNAALILRSPQNLREAGDRLHPTTSSAAPAATRSQPFEFLSAAHSHMLSEQHEKKRVATPATTATSSTRRAAAVSSEPITLSTLLPTTPLDNHNHRAPNSIETYFGHQLPDVVEFEENRFSLPTGFQSAAAFQLLNGGELTDYKWLALYDQCEKKSYKVMDLVGMDPPREENIGRMEGSKNISSSNARILNCNTILIPDLWYEPDRSKPNTFVYAGAGAIPYGVEVQKRAKVVGYRIDEPLDHSKGDDVMIRLPSKFRTFDIDFVAIYSEDDSKFLAWLRIPPLLVPPCTES